MIYLKCIIASKVDAYEEYKQIAQLPREYFLIDECDPAGTAGPLKTTESQRRTPDPRRDRSCTKAESILES